MALDEAGELGPYDCEVHLARVDRQLAEVVRRTATLGAEDVGDGPGDRLQILAVEQQIAEGHVDFRRVLQRGDLFVNVASAAASLVRLCCAWS